MGYFHSSYYRFYNRCAKQTFKFFLISDIHFSSNVDSVKLNVITKQAEKLNPNYILIPGDLLDSLDSIDDEHEFRRLKNWLAHLGKIAPTLICLGNHDFYRKNPAHNNIFSKEGRWFSEKSSRFIEVVNQIGNVMILDNQSYKSRDVYIFGFTQSSSYFQFDHDKRRNASLLRPGGENLSVMLKDLNTIDQGLISKLPKNKVKIALIHSPIYLTHPKVAAKLVNFDFIISGHMHNGIVPPVLNEIWHSDRGIIAPGKRIFPHGSRVKIRSNHDRIITLGAVSTIQSNTFKLANHLNNIYPVNIATLELSRDQSLERKPDVQHRYYSF